MRCFWQRSGFLRRGGIDNGQGTPIRCHRPGKEIQDFRFLNVPVYRREEEVIEVSEVVGAQPEAGGVEAVQGLDPAAQGAALHSEEVILRDALLY